MMLTMRADDYRPLQILNKQVLTDLNNTSPQLSSIIVRTKTCQANVKALGFQVNVSMKRRQASVKGQRNKIASEY